MKATRWLPVSSAALALALSACADQPTGVKSPSTFISTLASKAPSMAVTGGPNLSDYLTFQGQVWICKDGNQPGTSFAIDYTVVVQSSGAPVASGTVNVPLGQCVLATSVSTQTGGRYVVTATEQAPPADWSLTAIDWAYGANLPISPPAPTINLATRTISALLIANDVGVQLTFTNTYTAPPPPPSEGCTYTQGYWKNHASAWPVASVTLGNVTYSKAQAIAILKTPVKGNGLVSLSYQLIAAKLNIANGASPSAVASAIASADAMIGSLVAPSVGSGYLSTSSTSSLGTTLDHYNNGVTGPGHCD